MLDDLYTGALLDAAASIPAERRLPDADATARKVSKVCGSDVTVDLALRDGVVADVAMRVKACALGQASASILDRAIRGASPDELSRVHEEMIAMAWKHKNVYIGCDAHRPKYWPEAFTHYVNSFGQDKVIFGTDFPVLPFKRTVDDIDALALKPEARLACGRKPTFALTGTPRSVSTLIVSTE